jgi:DNA repair exonuclease SbcCD ATPase subunit
VLARLPDDLGDRLRTGRRLDDLPAVLEAATRALAWLGGLDRIEAARTRLGRLRGAVAGGAPPEVVLRRMRELEGAPAEFAALDEELRRHREDDVEVTGDLEQATMDWLRERQDAETRLQAYRDRARELKARLRQMEEGGAITPCPTCGRGLDDHFQAVLETLRDEWEGVVQDGSWWRRRREQLELKPEALQEMESRAVQLHATVQDLTQRAETARRRVDQLNDALARLAARGRDVRALGEHPAHDDVDEGMAAAVDEALAETGRQLAEHARRRLLDRTAAHLLRLSAGRLLGVRWTAAGRAELVGPEVDLPMPADEDAAAAQLAARLAAVELVWETAGVRHAALLIGDPFDRLDEAVKVRAADLLSERVGHDLVQVILVTRGEVVDLVPEAFDGVLEFRSEGGGGVLRPVPAGTGVIRIRT